MRFFSVVVLALCANFASAAVEIVHVWTGWRDEASFQGIGEFFEGKERTGDEIVRRTQADVREGFYFLVRLKAAEAQSAATVRVEVLLPDGKSAMERVFSVELRTGASVSHLGFTGKDWPQRELAPTAWRVTVLSSSGQVLAEQKSFLWEAPKP